MSADREFPLLRYVLLCGEVCEGEDGLPDAYGILSEITIVTEPGEQEYFDLKLYLLVSIYTEDENETYPIVMAVKTPSGHEGEVGQIHLGNVDGHFISTFASPISIETNTPGTHWLKVYYRRQLLGEVPLKVKFLQAISESQSAH